MKGAGVIADCPNFLYSMLQTSNIKQEKAALKNNIYSNCKTFLCEISLTLQSFKK
jgi:hypothetical protein